MRYDIKTHGDSLEKEYSDFIHTNFNTYEAVWKLFIGNKGNDTKADIVGYPIDREKKRQQFSEHTYTILQSVILLQRLINNEIFIKNNLTTVSEILDLQDSLLLFFTHLGRIRDNVEEASTCLLNADPKKITQILDEFYHKRHISVHGKMIPIIFKANGEILLPVLSKSGVDISGWNHKRHNWQDIINLPTESLGSTVSQLYWDLLPKLVQIFGEFKNKIEAELNAKRLVLKFDYDLHRKLNSFGSGLSSACAVNVYGMADKDFNKWLACCISCTVTFGFNIQEYARNHCITVE